MLNENGYLMDMRSLAGPSGIEQQQAPITYSHMHHHNMGMYTHDQQTQLRTHMEQPQSIMMQPQQDHQISYIHHPLMNITHQIPPKQDMSDPAFSVKILVKDNKVAKPKNKVGTAKIVKRKPPPPPPPPVIVQPPPDPQPTDEKTQKRKGRKRKYAQSRQERKENMYKNLPYINSRNQEVKPKEFEDYNCKCPLKCRKRVSVEVRRQEFEAFYALGSYTAQNVFLLERIKEINKKSKMPKVGKKKTKKKSQKVKREKNFPKMSSKYKKSQIISDDDSDSDCKEGILLDLQETKLQEVNKGSDSTEDKKCFGDCANEDCPHRILPIKHVYQYEKPLIIESTSFQYSHPDNNIIFTNDKNSYFHYKNINIDEANAEFLADQDQQVPNIDNNVCGTIQTKDQTELQGTISVLQVTCPTMENSIHVTSSDDTISNIQIVDGCQESDQMHSQIACVSLQPSQHIIYTSEHIPYNNHEIIYQTQHLQTDDGCQNQQILNTDHQISHETIFISQDSNICHLTIETEPESVSKKKRKPIKTERKFTRIYRLKKIRVCREMFVKTLKISSGRVNTVLKKNRSGDGLYRKSGNQGGHNKLSEEQKMGVYNHISSMLQYMAQNPQSPPFFETKLQQKSPFPSGFSLKSIYKVYKSSREIAKPVSFTSYSRIFYKEFNPKKQTNTQQSSSVVDNSEKIIVLQPINEYNTQTQQTNNINITKSYENNNIDNRNSRLIEEPIYANSLPIHVYTQEIVESNSSQSDEPRKKGRKRKYGDLTRQERKYNMYRNLPYVNSRKQQVLPKQFEDYDCQCPLKCKQRVSPKERKREFDGYYNLGSYVAQNMYLLERVEECKKKRCYIKNRPAKRERNFSRVYKLSKVRVCREMFLKTLKISSVRVNTVLNKKRCGEESTYKRGLKQGGMNKITLEQKNGIVEHINCIIASLSTNQQPNSDGDFVFPQEYTFKRMYEIYIQNNHSGKNVSFSTYRRVFNEKFDFRIKNF